MWRQVAMKISQAIDDDFECQSVERVSGGDINQAAVLSDQRNRFFIKWNQTNKIDMFAKEVLSLNTIASTSTIRVPQVITYGIEETSSFLVLEYLDLQCQGEQGNLAKSLALMHQQCAAEFGFSQDNYIGSTPQTNQWRSDWIEFYSQERLGTQKALLCSKGAATGLIEKLSRLQGEMSKFFVGYTPRPGLVHGDLWQGNYGFSQEGEPVVYDPACYYADFEVDLAMMELFSNPGSSFFEIYHEHNPIDSGYQTRKSLYNLYHVLNHANLFGGSYAMQAEGIIERLLDY